MSKRTADSTIRRHVTVLGRVQGVGFRWATGARATDLGITGYVRNLPDGSVEVEAQGSPEQVDAMLEWLRAGPPFARVEGMDVSERELVRETGFDIR